MSALIARWAGWVVKHARLVIGCVLVVTAGLGSELRHLRLDVRLGDQVPRDHPYTKIDERLSTRLGSGKTVVLAVAARHGDVFSPAVLGKLKRLTDALGRMPGVIPTTVMSLASPRAKLVHVVGDDIRVSSVLERIPETSAELSALRAAVLSYPMYVGNLISADATGALVVGDFREDTDNEEVTRGLEALAARERDDDADVLVGGQPPTLAAMNDETRNIVPIVLLAVVIIGAVHYEAFRTGQAVVLPLLTAGLSVVWGMGLMSLFGVMLEPWSAGTAVLILSVAAGHAVQILKRYYESYAELGDNRAAVVASLTRIGPVTITAGTVAAVGFGSLAWSGVPAVRNFGLTAAAGIMSALVIEMSFIPACRAMLTAPQARELTREREHRLLDRALEGLTSFVCTRPRVVVTATALVVLVIGLGIARLHITFSYRSWFPPRAAAIVADRIIRERFTGTTTIRILIEGHEPDALLDPRVLQGMVELQTVLAADPDVTATLSLADYVRVMQRAMHDGRPEEYRIPERKALVAQYLLFFGPDDLERVVTSDYQTGGVFALTRTDDAARHEALFARLQAAAAGRFPDGITVGIAGGEAGELVSTNSGVVRDKLLNMLQIGCVILVLSAWVFRAWTAGLLVVAPLASAMVVNLGVMGWVGLPLSFTSATFTAMGVSLGADFAIYLLFRLREEVADKPLPLAVAETMRTAGKATFFVASAVAAGYLALTVSGFSIWRQAGVFVALMMATSALATLTLLPGLVLLRPPRFLRAPPRGPA